MKKLVEYRNKAKWATVGTTIGGAVFAAAAAAMESAAETAYYDDLTSSLFSSELAQSWASEKLASDLAVAGAVSSLATLLVAVAGIALMLWMLANLLIAYKTPDDEEEPAIRSTTPSTPAAPARELADEISSNEG